MTSQVKKLLGVWTGAESSLWRVKGESPDTRVTHAVSVVAVGLQLHNDRTLENKTEIKFKKNTENCSTSLLKQKANFVRETSTSQCQRGKLPVVLSGLIDGSSSHLRSAAGSMQACVCARVFYLAFTFPDLQWSAANLVASRTHRTSIPSTCHKDQTQRENKK